jgi:hypothetical protein
MASEQMQQLAALFEAGRERFSRNNLGLQDVRDICEGLHAASAEPEGVTYAEVDAGGVPALWCIPAECDANSVLLHSHAGGSVVFSMHTDRKTAGYGEHELLAGEAIEFAESAKGAALDVTLHPIPDGQHSFILGAGRVPEADQAIQEAGRWLRSKLGLAAALNA